MDIDMNNGWNDKNDQILRNWKNNIYKGSIVYDIIINKYRTKLHRILLWSLIFTSLCTIIGGISSALLTVDDKKYIWIAFVLNIIVALFNATATVLTSSIKIYKFDEFVESLSVYSEKLDQFYIGVSAQLLLPFQFRDNAIEYIKKTSQAFIDLIGSSPDISNSDYSYSNQKYEKYLQDKTKHFKINNKYVQDDCIIDII